MNESEETLLQHYRKRRELVGYPFLEWSGSIIAVLAYLSLFAAGANALKVLSTSASDLDSGEKALWTFVSIVAGVLSFILMKGVSSVCFLLLDLWKSRKQ